MTNWNDASNWTRAGKGSTWKWEYREVSLVLRLTAKGWKGRLTYQGEHIDTYETSPALTLEFVQADSAQWAIGKYLDIACPSE